MGYVFSRSHQMTLGADFSVIEKEIYPNELWRFQIWDLAGQPIFKEVRGRFYNGSMGALVVFDITNKKTLKDCTIWIRELFKYCGQAVVPIVLLANKTDLRTRKSVSMKEIQKFVDILNKGTKSFGVENTVLETSAKTGLNINEAFKRLGTAIRTRF
ncbi:MAG: GTPase KRas precursor [Candidatus Heimdallarchaeota archaeon AB_125]|nr:MAG: GTPase KRas precursor [Candidatus Heimdallarchaeota archaeon AB_125]